MTLKRILTLLTLTLLAAAPLRARAESGPESDPAYLPIDKAIDLKAIPPEVNVNLPRFLLKDAAAELTGGTNDPFAAAGVNLNDLLKDVKLIRFVVIEAKEPQRAELARGVAKLRGILEKHWTPLATVPEENVGVYALSDPSGEHMAGLAVLIHDGGDTVIANIVGRVSVGKIVKVASQFDKFPKDLLKKLSAPPEGKPASPETAKKPSP